MESGSPQVTLDDLMAHRAWVRRVALGLSGNAADADDLEQELWLRALEHRPRDEGAARGWLRTVLTRLALDRRRRRERRNLRESSPRVPGPEVSTPELVAQAEAHRRVVDAVMDLEEPYRSTILLRFFEGLPLAQVAERQGVPLETVRTRLRRALSLLRGRLGGDRGGAAAWAPLLLFGGRGAPGTAAGVASAATAAAVAGGTVMALKGKAVAAAAAVLLLGGVVWKVSRPERPAAEESDVARAVAEPEVAPEPRARSRAEPTEDAPGAPASTSRNSVPAVTGKVVDDENGAPVPGAQVALGSRERASSLVAVTSADGSFRIESEDGLLQPRILVRAEGYADYRRTLPWRKSESTTAPGEAGEIRLVRGAVVAGRVTLSDRRSPAAGATLFLQVGGIGSGLAVVRSNQVGEADPEGDFELEHVGPPEWSPYHLFAIGDEGIGGCRLPAAAGRSDVRGVEIGLAATGRAHVEVRDAQGAPVRGARVIAVPRFEPFSDPYQESQHDVWLPADSPFARFLAATTGDDGTANLDRLPLGAGSHDFLASHGSSIGWKDGVLVEGHGTTRVDIDLHELREWAIVGRVLTDVGVPLAGAQLSSSTSLPEVVTGPDGSYRLGPLAASWSYVVLSAKAPGFAISALRVDHDRAEGDVRRDIMLERALSVRGRVVDQSGRPVPGANITLTQGNELDVRRIPLVRTDSDGRFRIDGVPAGRWRLRAKSVEPQDWATLPVTWIEAGDLDVEVLLEHLGPASTRVTVEVVDAVSEQPLAASRQSLLRVGGEQKTAWSYRHVEIRDGSVEYEGVREGRWRAWVDVPGYAPAFTEFDVVPGLDEVHARVRVGRPAVLRGRVVRSDPGVPLPRMVHLQSHGGRGVPSWAGYRTATAIGAEFVDDAGEFVFSGLAPGLHRLRFSEGGSMGEFDVDVPSGGEAFVTIEARRGALLRFRSDGVCPTDRLQFLVSRVGGPWENVMLLGGQEGRSPMLTLTLPPGLLRWRVVPLRHLATADQVADEGEAVLVAGETTEVTFDLPER